MSASSVLTAFLISKRDPLLYRLHNAANQMLSAQHLVASVLNINTSFV